MLKPQISFLAYDKRQIDTKWLDKKLGFEGNIFNGNDLNEAENWDRIKENLDYILKSNSNILTLHFPTENANYLKNTNAKHQLYDFIDLAIEKNISGITLHTNQFLTIDQYLKYDLKKNRKDFMDFIKNIDNYIGERNLWIGIENLPIIGNEGDDFDPLFIYPEDYNIFNDYNLRNIGITWDICHWFITIYTQQSMCALTPNQNLKTHNYLDFLQLSDKIKHFHFSSFKNLAFPLSNAKCEEGKPPQEGIIDIENLEKCILSISNVFNDTDIGITFEVQEEDYNNRINNWKTLEWFENIIS